MRATFDDPESKLPVLDRVVEGDASEAGILKCAECIYGRVSAYQAANPKLFEVPFNSTNKYQVKYSLMFLFGVLNTSKTKN